MPLVVAIHSCVATWWRAVRTGSMPRDFVAARATASGLAVADAILAPSAAFAAAVNACYGAHLEVTPVPNGRRRIGCRRAVRRAGVLTAGRLWDPAKNVATLDEAAAGITEPVFAAGPLAGPNGAHAALETSSCSASFPNARWRPAMPMRPCSSASRSTSRSASPCSKRRNRARARAVGHRHVPRVVGGRGAVRARPRQRGGARAIQRLLRDRWLARAHGRARRRPRQPLYATTHARCDRSRLCRRAGDARLRSRGERARHEDRHLCALARLVLEPRQRAFPARPPARARAPRARGRGVRARRWLEPAEPRPRPRPGRARTLRRAFPSCVAHLHGRRGRLRHARRRRPGDRARVERTRSWCARSARCASARGRSLLLFHDTHHRAVSGSDGIRVVRPRRLRRRARLRRDPRRGLPPRGLGQPRLRLARGGGRLAFSPPADEGAEERRGLVWIGNWGDEERSAELETFLLRPARDAGLPLDVYGVRYPDAARQALETPWRALSRLAAEHRRAERLRPASGDGARAAPLRMSRRCPASRRSACSRRWPAASRSSRRPGATRKACSAPAATSSWPRARSEMRLKLGALARRPGPACSARRQRTGADPRAPHVRPSRRRAPRHRREPPRRTSCSARSRLMQIAFLRLEPLVELLERRGDVLPRPHRRAGAARLQDDVLRARCLRPPAAPRHRSAGLGHGRRLSGDSRR